jgi:diguanylate cyclase (GGDEF)-like protein
MTDPQCSVQSITHERLQVLLRIGMRLAAERNLDRLLAMIMEETTAAMQADRSTLYLIDREKQEMWAKIAQGVETVELRFPVGTGIAGQVGKTGEIINIPDAYQDPRFNPEFDQRTGYRTKSILCAPLKSISGTPIGAVQVLNRREGRFLPEDEVLLTALASQAAVAIENAGLYLKLHDLNESLEEKVRERTADLLRANERLSMLNRELADISVTDGLTQAYNRQHFMDRLRQEVKRADRYRTQLSLIMLDIDHFKRVNDSFGHQAGDAVLAGISQKIRERLRDTDLFARYGGEEFCVIAIAMDAANAYLLADRLRDLIAQTVFQHNGRVMQVTVSMGVSSWRPEIGERFEELIRLADEALYRAKREGRNRVCQA